MRIFILAVVVLVLAAMPLAAQDPVDYSNGFAPYMSYDTLGFDNVNLLTGSVFIHIPIISYPQKGTLPDFSQSFIVGSAEWQYSCVYIDWVVCGPVNQGVSGQIVIDGMLTATTDFYEEGMVYDSNSTAHNTAGTGGANYQNQTYDGTGISTISIAEDTVVATVPIDRNGISYYPMMACPPYFPALVTHITDPSGNSIAQENACSGSSAWTDSVGRTIPVLAANCSPNYMPGPPGNDPVTVTICESSFAVDQTVGGVTTDTGTFEAISSITLPNGTSWTFNYNGYGDISNVTTPTGGTVSYTWSHVGWGCSHGVSGYADGYCFSVLTQRTVNANPGAEPSQAKTWTYSGIGPTDYAFCTYYAFEGTCAGPTTVTDPDGNDVVHTFSLLDTGDAPNSARETDTKYYQGSSSSSSNLIKEVITQYSWAGDDPNASAMWGNPMPYDVVPRRLTTKWYSGGSVVNTTQTCAIFDNNTDTTCSATSGPDSYSSSTGQVQAWACCDTYGDVEVIYTSSYFPIVLGSQLYNFEYDYGTSSPGSLLRKTVNHFKWQSSSSYENLGLLSIPDSVNVYDGSGNQAAETTYAYDESSRSTSACQTTPCGLLTTTNKYTNSSTYLTSHINYDSNGMPTDLYDANGNHTCNTYDSTGAYLYEVQHPNPSSGSSCSSSLVDYFSYDSNTGLLVSHTDANSQTTSYTYDTIRRPASISYPDGGEEAYSYTDSSTPNPYFTYTKAITSSLNFTSTGIVDGFGRKEHTQLTSDPSGTDYVDYTYDNEGRVASQTNPYRSGSSPTDGTTSYSYDPLNRVTTVTESDGGTVSTSYAGACTTVTDEASKKREWCKDGIGRTTQVFEDPAGLNYETDYTYNPLDELISVNQKGGSSSSSNWRTRTFTYDWLSRLVCAASPEIQIATCPSSDSGSYTTGTIRYTYDGNGNLLTKQSPEANQGITSNTTIISYCYDALNRMTQKHYASGSCPFSTPDVSYVYDGNSVPSGCSIGSFSYGSYLKTRMTAMCDSSGSEAKDYDKMGRVATDQRITSGYTRTFTYATSTYPYNYDGSIYKLEYPSGHTITYTYNGAEQPVSAVDSTGTTIDYATSAVYAPPGKLTSVTNGSSIYFTAITNSRLQACWQYATTGTALSWSGTTCSTSESSAGNILDLQYNLHYGSGDNGDVFKVTNNRNTNRNINYTYDALNRITAAHTDGSLWGETYIIDPWGNFYQNGAYGSLSEPDTLSQTPTTKNQFYGMSYDAAGNLENDGSNSYTYDAENRISAVGSSYTYYYDGDGERIWKSGTSSKMYWYGQNNDPLLETDGSGNLTYEYVFLGRNRIARRDSSGNVDYYFGDHLGSARVVTNSSGAILDDIDYCPYGRECYVASSSSGNTYLFTGKERDSESGLDNFGARYNSSQYGRFMSPDPLGGSLTDPQTLNKYSYVRNNPLNLTDPTGMYVCADDPTDGSSHCASAQDQAFEKSLNNLRNSTGDVGRAAAAYGAVNDANGVTVGFANLNGSGENGNTVSTIGYANGQFQADSNVTINSTATGADFDAAIGHEGSHVADAQDVVNSGLTEDGQKIYAGENITQYASEQRAYGVTNSILSKENESEHFNCGLSTCTLGKGVAPGQVPGTVDQMLRSNANYNVNGKPMSSTNQGRSVVNGVDGQRPTPNATVPH